MSEPRMTEEEEKQLLEAVVQGERRGLSEELRRRLKKDASLRGWLEQMEAARGLLKEAQEGAGEEWRLSEGRRNRLKMELVKANTVVNLKQDASRFYGAFIGIGVAAVLVVVLLMMGFKRVPPETPYVVTYAAPTLEDEQAGSILPELESGSPMLEEGVASPADRRRNDLEAPLASKRMELPDVERKPASPSGSMARVIAANVSAASAIAVPDVVLPAPPDGFGNVDPLADHWWGGIEGVAKPFAFKADTLSFMGGKQRPFEVLVEEEGQSTFSLNVSEVSFELALEAVRAGRYPNSDTIRAEEFVNAMNYRDSGPGPGEKVTLAMEQAAFPLMPNRNLLRLGVKAAAAGREAGVPLHLTVLIDRSGSMERADRMQAMEKGLRALFSLLRKKDRISLVTFDRQPRILGQGVRGDEATTLLRQLALSPVRGGTNFHEALETGFGEAKLRFSEMAQNRVVLFTDGAANLGDVDPKRLARLVAKARGAGLALDVIGVGAAGLDDRMLRTLARQGDGRYFLLQDTEDAGEAFATQVAGALRPAAKNVKVQVTFNPERVRSYHLYDFREHLLKAEDFLNDSVDAAEMAAEESGVALYHYELVPGGRGPVGMVSVRFQDVASGRMVQRSWDLEDGVKVKPFAEADPRLRLAALAAWTAEKLRGGVLTARIPIRELRQWAIALEADFGNSQKFLELKTIVQALRN